MKTMASLKLKCATFAAAAFLAGLVGSAQAQNTPVGTPWDIVLSGPQGGLMQLTFVADFTLNGFEIITEKPKTTHQPDDGDVRTPGGDGRGFDDNGSSATIHYYGGANIEGTWTYDTRGRVIGVLN